MFILVHLTIWVKWATNALTPGVVFLVLKTILGINTININYLEFESNLLNFFHRLFLNIILMTSFIGHNTPVHVTISTITFSMCAHDTRRFHDKNGHTIYLFDISTYVQIHNIYFLTHKILYTVMLFFYSKFQKDNFTPMLTSGFQI